MATLSTRRHEDVRACISSILRDTLAEELALLPSKSHKASYECLTSVISALQSVVSSAVREFSEEWAAAHVDPLMALPGELAARCFAELDLDDRITVSHVSQAWRSFALAERTLWNAYEVSDEVSRKTAAHALETLLARSRPAPFSLTYTRRSSESESESDSDSDSESDDEPRENGKDKILEIVFRNMEYMGSLTLASSAALLRMLDPSLTLRAPNLKRLEFDSFVSHATIPAEWGPRCVPRLEVLVLGDFTLPPDCQPFAALRKLDGGLPASGFFPDVAFSEVFPNLRELVLVGVEARSLPMLTPLPPSVHTARFYPGRGRKEIDYSQFLHSCRCASARIRNFRLAAVSRVSDVLELFVRMSTGPWKLYVRDADVQLKDASCGMAWEILCHRNVALTREPRFAAHLDRLADLTLALPSFLDLQKLGVRVLPTLRALALFVITDKDIEAGRAFVRSHDAESLLTMPALKSIKLLPGNDTDFDGWLTEDAPGFLPLLLCGSKLPLATLCLRIVGMPRLSPEHQYSLSPFARRILVESASFPGMKKLFDGKGGKNSERARD